MKRKFCKYLTLGLICSMMFSTNVHAQDKDEDEVRKNLIAKLEYCTHSVDIDILEEEKSANIIEIDDLANDINSTTSTIVETKEEEIKQEKKDEDERKIAKESNQNTDSNSSSESTTNTSTQEETVADTSSSDTGDCYLYGTFELTAYCATGNACADGAYPSVGYTVACNDPALWHKWIYIEGYGTYYVHDTGGMASNVVDIFMGSYDECIQFGRRTAAVYVYN